MYESKKTLKGSRLRDIFKANHKIELGGAFYACDLDLCLVTKCPYPDIICAIDFKGPYDDITFSEVVTYNALMVRGIPLYVVCGDPEVGRFRISRYTGGNHEKPDVNDYADPIQVKNWSEFRVWEQSIRDEHFRKFAKKSN